MASVIPLWLHILAAAIWVGSQVMMFAVVIPSLRLAENAGVRSLVLRNITARFGYLGAASLVVLVLTGLENITRYAPDDIFSYRYGYILAIKLVMVALVVLLTVYHAAVVGPRLLAAQSSSSAGQESAAAEMRSLRARSIAASSATLVLSIAILFCAALLRAPYSFGAS